MIGHDERMYQQSRCRSREPAILAKPVAVQPEPALQVADQGDASLTNRKPVAQALLNGPKGALGSGSIENQVARLNDTRLPIRQRQTLAAEIGRVQGNRQLQRVMARLRENKGEQKYTLTPFSHVPGQPAGRVVQRLLMIAGKLVEQEYEAYNWRKSAKKNYSDAAFHQVVSWTGDEKEHNYQSWEAAFDAAENMQLRDLTFEFDEGHGSLHFGVKPTRQKSKWSISEAEAKTLMENEIKRYMERLREESRKDVWEPWYIGGQEEKNIGKYFVQGERDGKDINKFTIQAQVNLRENKITYHGYPDEKRDHRIGAGKSKRTIKQ